MKANVPPNIMLNAALAYAAQRLPIFPCKPQDKRPHTHHGFKDATKDTKQTTTWWKQWPEAMIGVPMGAASGVFCVDLDLKDDKNGIATWQAWLLEWNIPAPITREHGTPSGGKHLLFLWESGIRNIPLGKLGPGVEIKGDGGYICVPPSRRADGKAYEITNASEPTHAPQQLLDKIFAYWGQRADGAGTGTATGADTNEKPDPELDKLVEQDLGEGVTPEPPPDEEEVKAALQAIPAEDYEHWYKLGAAIFNTYGERGYLLFVEWSKTSNKFNAKDCARKWEQVQNVKGINVGTIFHYADQADPTWRERYEQRQQKQKEEQKE